jgi:hypothetical protein
MITANVVHCVFRIRCENKAGSAFTIDVEDHQYLITARHLCVHGTGTIMPQVYTRGDWAQPPMSLVAHTGDETDISVFRLATNLAPRDLPLAPSSAGLIYGQDVYFLGFPYDYVGAYAFGPNGFPLPFVKKATVSLMDPREYLLDGHNNPGFSGGPVVFREPGAAEFKVAGVISAFRAQRQPIMEGERDTALHYIYNTGIVVSHHIEHALDLIRSTGH